MRKEAAFQNDFSCNILYLLYETVAFLDTLKMVVELYDGTLIQSVDRPPALFQEGKIRLNNSVVKD